MNEGVHAVFMGGPCDLITKPLIHKKSLFVLEVPLLVVYPKCSTGDSPLYLVMLSGVFEIHSLLQTTH